MEDKELKCEDCLAHYPANGYTHVCPPLLKFLVTFQKKKNAKDML